MRTIIEASAVVIGEEMAVLNNSYILIDNCKIVEIGQGKHPKADLVIKNKNYVIIPGIINTHTHIGDSAFKDAGYGQTVDELFRPPDGLKHNLLKSVPAAVTVSAITETIQDMLQSGVTTFADFRENGVAGIQLLLAALTDLKIRYLLFGRPNYVFTKSQLDSNTGAFPESIIDSLKELLTFSHGLAPSSPNDLTDEGLTQLACAAKICKKLKATHVAENPKSIELSKRRTGLTEIERAIRYLKADLLIHLIYVTSNDLDLVADTGLSVVCCPRSNAALGLNLPPIPEMIDKKINVALGTDNVMLNSPDMFREMEFTLTAYSIFGLAKRRLTPRDVFKMATINGAKALGINHIVGSISEGKNADLIVLNFDSLNLRHTNDILTTVVHRGRPDNVELVLIGGEVVYDSDLAFKQRTLY